MVLSRLLFIGSVSLAVLAACSGSPQRQEIKMEGAEYWQRKNAPSAIYMQGPKAQQRLHMDISACVSTLSEMRNLEQVRRVIPTTYQNGNAVEPRPDAQQKLDSWDTPERDGFLYAEHADYHDFETCMMSKGWERVQYLPYDDAEKARQQYLNRHKNTYYSGHKMGRENVTTIHQPSSLPSASGDIPFND